MATSIGTMFGKVGAIMGNILIGFFIDVYCIVPIIVSCSFLISKYKRNKHNPFINITTSSMYTVKFLSRII